MAFERYQKSEQGRRLEKDFISIRQTRVYFGTDKPDYNYLVIEYDTEEKAIRFSEGNPENGYKVYKYKVGGYYINTPGFMKRNLLPIGWYIKTANLTYKLKDVK